MSYTLTLTAAERRVFDWVGDRYAAGSVARLLWLACCPKDAEWDGCDPNDLTTYAVAFGVIWLSWLLAVIVTPLHRLPLTAHAAFGLLWCFGGCCLTASV